MSLGSTWEASWILRRFLGALKSVLSWRCGTQGYQSSSLCYTWSRNTLRCLGKPEIKLTGCPQLGALTCSRRSLCLSWQGWGRAQSASRRRGRSAWISNSASTALADWSTEGKQTSLAPLVTWKVYPKIDSWERRASPSSFSSWSHWGRDSNRLS